MWLEDEEGVIRRYRMTLRKEMILETEEETRIPLSGELALEEASRKTDYRMNERINEWINEYQFSSNRAHSAISCISNIRQVTVSIQHGSIIMYS